MVVFDCIIAPPHATISDRGAGAAGNPLPTVAATGRAFSGLRGSEAPVDVLRCLGVPTCRGAVSSLGGIQSAPRPRTLAPPNLPRPSRVTYLRAATRQRAPSLPMLGLSRARDVCCEYSFHTHLPHVLVRVLSRARRRFWCHVLPQAPRCAAPCSPPSRDAKPPAPSPPAQRPDSAPSSSPTTFRFSLFAFRGRLEFCETQGGGCNLKAP